MVNASVTDRAEDAERLLAISYAAPHRRPAVTALLALDDRLGAIVRATREPLVGQMRLTWWHDALTALDLGPPPAEPILQALSRDVIGPVSGGDLAIMVEGWEVLLEPLDAAALRIHAEKRGSVLFAAIGNVVGSVDDAFERAGEGWALADLSSHLSDEAMAREARDMARERIAARGTHRWPAPARVAGALSLSAEMDLARPMRPRGHPARVARLMWLRMTGR